MQIKLDRLDQLCGKDKAKKRQFLLQFLELVPPVLEQVEVGLKNGDREKLRKGIHFLAPQLSFFGISDFTLILGQLDAQPPIPLAKLKGTIEASLLKINKAVTEVRKMI